MVGIQDQISASFGGFNKISIEKNGSFKINKIKIDNKIKKFQSKFTITFYWYT